MTQRTSSPEAVDFAQRNEEIVAAVALGDETMAEIGARFGITRQRVEQIARRAGIESGGRNRLVKCHAIGCKNKTWRENTYCFKHRHILLVHGDVNWKRPQAAHGTPARYSAGCRCTRCRAAMSRQRQEWAAQRRREGRIPHGTENGYTNYGCRCDACKAAGKLANKRGAMQRKKAS